MIIRPGSDPGHAPSVSSYHYEESLTRRTRRATQSLAEKRRLKTSALFSAYSALKILREDSGSVQY